MRSSLTQTLLIVPIALLTWGAQLHAQGERHSLANAQTEHQRQYAELTAQQPAFDRSTAPQIPSSNIARIRMSADGPADELRQAQPRSNRRSAQPPPKVSPIRFASFEADLTPPKNAVKSFDAPSGNYAVPEPNEIAPPANQNDLAPIKHAFGSLRGHSESNLASPIAARSQPMKKAARPERNIEAERALMADLNSRGKTQLETTSDDKPVPAKTLGLLGQDGSRELIERIAYNTMFVLAFGVGFIFVARAWIKPTVAKASEKQSEFEVLSTLKLPSKSNLMLVKVDNERLMVALDATGVKSVVHLSDSFADKLEAYSDMPDEAIDFDLPPRRPAVERDSESPVYSMDAVRKERPKKPTPPKVADRPVDAAKNTEAIREQMEAALLKFGLKGLV